MENWVKPDQKRPKLYTVPTWAWMLVAGPGNEGLAGAVGSVEPCLLGNPALATL